MTYKEVEKTNRPHFWQNDETRPNTSKGGYRQTMTVRITTDDRRCALIETDRQTWREFKKKTVIQTVEDKDK